MLKRVDELALEFLNLEKKPIRIISHYDTDGITSAAILAKTFQRLNRKFSIRIVKNLEKEIVEEELKRHKKEIIIFSDLGSGSLKYLKEVQEPVFVLDHHELKKESINENIKLANPHLTKNPKENECTGSGICYLFSKAISKNNQDLSKLALIGLIGDRYEDEISKINKMIINDVKELTIRKGPIIYPSTRPLKRALEWSTSPYIPGVTGSSTGVSEFLKETGISGEKSLIELNDDEMSKLITALTIKQIKNPKKEPIVGNIYILKFFNTREDVREISVLINACSRLGYHDIALAYCLEKESAKLKALDIYNEYKQEILNGIKIVERVEKIKGEGFIILNARDQIKDAIIGTICSMISSSPIYEEGTILIGMAYNQNKIKVSARMVGRTQKNLKEIIEKTVSEIKYECPNIVAEVGGHQYAAGCLIEKEKEREFIEKLKKNLEIELIRV